MDISRRKNGLIYTPKMSKKDRTLLSTTSVSDRMKTKKEQ